MANDIKNYIRETRDKEVDTLLEEAVRNITEEGLSVEFGKIGIHTTYAMIHNEDHSIEILGYTFLRDLKFYKENVGKLKALQQALARKQMASNN